MSRIANLKLLLAAALFAVVTAKVSAYIPFDPNNNPFIPQIPQESTEHPPVYKEIVFGEDIEGAIELYNYESNYSYGSQRSEISSSFSYPYKGFQRNSVKISKISILVEETNDQFEADAVITRGGLGENNVSLDILAKNTQKLHYKIKIYGEENA